MLRSKTCAWLTVITVSVLTAVAASQTTRAPKKAGPKKQSSHPAFVCPDAEAKQSCKSYEELLQAKDPDLPKQGYICFRKGEDEFFGVVFSAPYFLKHWDSDSREMVADSDATSPGSGSARTYKDGVEDSRIQPYLFFRGKWSAFGASALFASDDVYTSDIPDNKSAVSIDDTQFSISAYKYKNATGQVIEYNMTIQLSTGRFSERFVEQSKQVPLVEDGGRCIYLKGK